MKNTDLAKKIKTLRTKKGYSQEQLANLTELSLRTVQRIENGETGPRGDTLIRLANALTLHQMISSNGLKKKIVDLWLA